MSRGEARDKVATRVACFPGGRLFAAKEALRAGNVHGKEGRGHEPCDMQVGLLLVHGRWFHGSELEGRRQLGDGIVCEAFMALYRGHARYCSRMFQPHVKGGKTASLVGQHHGLLACKFVMGCWGVRLDDE